MVREAMELLDIRKAEHNSTIRLVMPIPMPQDIILLRITQSNRSITPLDVVRGMVRTIMTIIHITM